MIRGFAFSTSSGGPTSSGRCRGRRPRVPVSPYFTRVSYSTRATMMREGGRRGKTTSLTDLPDVPLDIIMSYLEADHVRALHQVSRACKLVVESRHKDNERRMELVKSIRENKENIVSTGVLSQGFPFVDRHPLQPNNQYPFGTPPMDMRRSTSCSSIAGIDLPSGSRQGSMVNVNLSLNLNLSKLNWNSPLRTPEVDGSCSKLSCTRNGWAGRGDSLHNSRLSDSGLSCDSESFLEPANFFPSPVPEFERGRNYHDFSPDGTCFSLSSIHWQRSDHSSLNSIDQIHADVECTNQNCDVRFCSKCDEGDHSGRHSHEISSASLESSLSENIGSSTSSFELSREKRSKIKAKHLKKSFNRLKL